MGLVSRKCGLNECEPSIISLLHHDSSHNNTRPNTNSSNIQMPPHYIAGESQLFKGIASLVNVSAVGDGSEAIAADSAACARLLALDSNAGRPPPTEPPWCLASLFHLSESSHGLVCGSCLQKTCTRDSGTHIDH